ncbi:MAG: hypothetical protein U0798_14425 [Gemmataceae bacterium]
MAKKKWTQNMRRIMFGRLHMEFGEYSTWGGQRYPNGKKEEYEKTLEQLSVYFSSLVEEVITIDAVRNQIDFALTKQEEFKDQSHIRNYILNLSAALEVDFMKYKDLPNYLKSSRE